MLIDVPGKKSLQGHSSSSEHPFRQEQPRSSLAFRTADDPTFAEQDAAYTNVFAT
jgi:hypothetical protein